MEEGDCSSENHLKMNRKEAGFMEWVRVLMQLSSAILMLATTIAQYSQANPLADDCQRNCGNISIPYPFGTKEGCYIDEDFLVTCNTTHFNPPRAFLTNSNIQILNISLSGQLRILIDMGYDCYDSKGKTDYFQSWLKLSKFPLSTTQNKFTAVGCDTQAFISGFQEKEYFTGCISYCYNLDSVVNGSCSGIGCCQTSIPKGVRGYNISLGSYNNHSNVLNSNPCSYGFVVEDGAYNFSSADFAKMTGREKFPVILDWSIENQTCREAKKNQTSYACKENTRCFDADNGPGYLCNCSKGFQGNPYLPKGCQDIDECMTLSPCIGTCKNFPGSFICSCPMGYSGDGYKNGSGCQDIDECTTLSPCNGTCNNLPGSFNCACPLGYLGDGYKNGSGCRPIPKHESNKFPWDRVALGISMSLLLLLLGSFWLYCGLRQRHIAKLRDKFFEQNGGFMLQQLSEHEGSDAKIFSVEELNKATNNYHESRVLGKGGQGTVYKGILSDGRIVAIKKANIGGESQVEQFINEVFVLSQVNHRNVVKLLGCCLETQVPLLVYEFVTNGTLFDYIHNTSHQISWKDRLRIATEAADALSHLHWGVSTPIIHRDVKTMNILLDDKFSAKVADFGASRLIPQDKSQLTTLVQGTLGYLDPEYFHTSQLTDKSDVYSFGVVLVELLTGRKALSFERPEEERNLAMHFISSEKEDRLFQVLDVGVPIEDNIEHLKEVATLAKRCLRVKGEDRPTMKEVAIKLEGLGARENQYLMLEGEINSKETQSLLDQLSESYGGNDTCTGKAQYDSIRKQSILTFDVDGR